jgi:hypothetical protein
MEVFGNFLKSGAEVLDVLGKAREPALQLLNASNFYGENVTVSH